MRHLTFGILTAILTTLAGCANFGAKPVNPGDSRADVLGKLGSPTHVYPDGKDQLLEYAHGPWGQTTYMARIGADGRLTSFQQVLTPERFATIKIGEANKESVLRTIGAPSEKMVLRLSRLEVWTYPYKEGGVWDSMMHVHFDDAGIVRKMENGPDMRRDPDSWGWFGMLRL
ncbi:MAG: outer membrane protein assembly factor BamE [Pseudomonadota bacterium]